ncbi:MAG TPA: multicopper oxidase domain-containing protein [Longimicrobiales bacterium]
MSNRREFLKTSALASAGIVLPWNTRASLSPFAGINALDMAAVPMWAQPFPKPPVYTPVSPNTYSIPISPCTQEIVPGLFTPVWGYGATYPGASIEATVGTPISVRFFNSGLPSTHLLPVDPTLHGTNMGEPQVRTTTHLHGGHVPPTADGYPEGWIDNAGQPNSVTRPGRPAPTDTYLYPNVQDPATLWYHDHALGNTRLNVYAGLAGFYLLRDSNEAQLNLPSGPYEVQIALQDRTFNPDGTLFYPNVGMNGVNPMWVPEFFGDVSVVNGKAFPFYNVEPRKYRFRLLNGCNSRFLNMRLFNLKANNNLGGAGPTMIQIGTDGGFLPAPVSLADASGNNPGRLMLGPGERADIIIDFSQFAGQRLVLHNNAPTPFAGSASAQGGYTPYTGTRHFRGGTIPLDQLLVFNVSPIPVSDPSVIPAALPSGYTPPTDPGTPPRIVELKEILNAAGMPLKSVIADGAGNEAWDMPLSGNASVGSQEVWWWVNTTADTHPVHLHLVQFRPLWRRSFSINQYVKTGQIQWNGGQILPDKNERGLKDTIRANPGEVTAMLVDFKVNFAGSLGYYPAHCHILEHEDHEMMREYFIG